MYPGFLQVIGICKSEKQNSGEFVHGKSKSSRYVFRNITWAQWTYYTYQYYHQFEFHCQISNVTRGIESNKKCENDIVFWVYTKNVRIDESCAVAKIAKVTVACQRWIIVFLFLSVRRLGLV